jgi:hypothetical protein
MIRTLKNSSQLPASPVAKEKEVEKEDTRETLVVQVKEKESGQTLKFRIYSVF